MLYTLSLFNIVFDKEGFDKVTFIANERHILAVNLDKLNLDNNNNFYENDPDTIIHFRLLAWRNASSVASYTSVACNMDSLMQFKIFDEYLVIFERKIMREDLI